MRNPKYKNSCEYCKFLCSWYNPKNKIWYDLYYHCKNNKRPALTAVFKRKPTDSLEKIIQPFYNLYLPDFLIEAKKRSIKLGFHKDVQQEAKI